MSEPKLLLCTDMDRTIIPNGAQSEDALARKRFKAFCDQPSVTLVYVTGRNLKLVEQAIKNYRLPRPDYAITDVGTRIYGGHNNEWQEMDSWVSEIDKDWSGRSHSDLKALFEDIHELQLQERTNQNTHKLSYYVALQKRQKILLDEMQRRLDAENIEASLVWSIDEPKSLGLLDVLPKNATKQHAVEFLRQHLGYTLEQTVFAGDSGNDLPVMQSGIPSVLVANTALDVKEEARRLAADSGNSETLYFAKGKSGNSGNYASGVLEGVAHFMPAFADVIDAL